MDRRTKILAGFFALAVACVLTAKVVYPYWITPLFTLDERIAQKSVELDKLEKTEAEVRKARDDLRKFAGRAGSFDQEKVENVLRERLNQLIAKHRLEESSVVPGNPTEDRKTGLMRQVISVNAVGSLQAAVEFMRDVAELPHLARLTNPSLIPAASGRRDQRHDRLTLRLPLEVLVVPEISLLGRVAKEEELVQPDSNVRHQGQPYAMIWERDPFNEPKPPPPPPPPPPVIKEPPKREEPKIVEPPPPPPPPDPRWLDRQNMQLCMALIRSDENTRLAEIMVHNTKSNENKYYKVGDDFNGGKLVYVHPRGIVAHRQGEYYVHPLGSKLDQEITAGDATSWPELQAAAERIREANPPKPPVPPVTAAGADAAAVAEGKPAEGSPAGEPVYGPEPEPTATAANEPGAQPKEGQEVKPTPGRPAGGSTKAANPPRSGSSGSGSRTTPPRRTPSRPGGANRAPTQPSGENKPPNEPPPPE